MHVRVIDWAIRHASGKPPENKSCSYHPTRPLHRQVRAHQCHQPVPSSLIRCLGTNIPHKEHHTTGSLGLHRQGGCLTCDVLTEYPSDTQVMYSPSTALGLRPLRDPVCQCVIKAFGPHFVHTAGPGTRSGPPSRKAVLLNLRLHLSAARACRHRTGEPLFVRKVIIFVWIGTSRRRGGMRSGQGVVTGGSKIFVSGTGAGRRWEHRTGPRCRLGRARSTGRDCNARCVENAGSPGDPSKQHVRQPGCCDWTCTVATRAPVQLQNRRT